MVQFYVLINCLLISGVVYLSGCGKANTRMSDSDAARKELALHNIEITVDNYQRCLRVGDQKSIDLFKRVGFSTNQFFGANLAWACAIGDVDIVSQEIGRSKSLDQNLDWHPPTPPLILACMHGNDQIVEILLKAGADPNIHRKIYTEQGEVAVDESPMIYAKRTGNKKTEKLLRDYGFREHKEN